MDEQQLISQQAFISDEDAQIVIKRLTEDPQAAVELFTQTRQFEELMMMYECAIREVKTKLEILDQEFSVRYRRNPIDTIESRVKTPASIVRKLFNHGHDICVENIKRYLNDVAGIRVICSFLDDIYLVARMLAKQDDVRVVRIKDYIRNPKDGGYRSYHMIVEIPVFFTTSKQYLRVEIQFRTIAMDFWASLEHQIRYKKNIENIEQFDEISASLKQAAATIAETDLLMQNIRNQIEQYHEAHDEQL